tara:strand:- start:263 stop:646 length:384 start_codon:yes stop_codon:yes gene_type:complete
MMPKSKYTAKQMKIARVAEPRDSITEADFDMLRNSKAGGGMLRFASGGSVDDDVRTLELEEMLKTAEESGDQDMIDEIKSDLFKETGRSYRYGGRVKGFKDGMSVEVGSMCRGSGSAVKGKKFSGTY